MAPFYIPPRSQLGSLLYVWRPAFPPEKAKRRLQRMQQGCRPPSVKTAPLPTRPERGEGGETKGATGRKT